MDKQTITIFYSWQSDLPNNETRGLIQDGINFAINSLKNVISVKADRDTKGEYGSPDINQTIFSKIEQCDIFIADISIVNKYSLKKEENNLSYDIKYTPNPNVLLELGYAANVVGWDNVICIINTDYGKIQDLPFDLSHRRCFSYSLTDVENSRNKIIKCIGDIIIKTINNITENGHKAKKGFTDLSIGSYLFYENKVSKILVPFSPSEYYSTKIDSKIKEKCKNLYNDIIDFHLSKRIKEEKKKDIKNIDYYSDNNKYVDINKTDKEIIIDFLKNENLLLTQDFFDLGNLKHKIKVHIADNGPDIIGTNDEIAKYNKINNLLLNIFQMNTMKKFSQTFDDYYLCPLAIQNNSSLKDEDITVYVSIPDDASAISPSKDLLIQDLKGMEGMIFRENYIKEFFLMDVDSTIRYDKDISYSVPDPDYYFKNCGLNGMDFDEEDYEKELSKYIAIPNHGRPDYYEFHIKSLRAKECCWLGPLIMIETKSKNIEIKYSIKSNNSDGLMSGVLEIINN